jgi:hypothetical protein
MKKKYFLIICFFAIFCVASKGWADYVDLSDVDTDQPVQSPSFQNIPPAGMAPGEPIESPPEEVAPEEMAEIPEPGYVEDSGSAMEDLEEVYQDTSAFDGGPGSTLNTSPAAYDEGYEEY